MGEFGKPKFEENNIGSWVVMGKGDDRHEIQDFDSSMEDSSFENSSTNSIGSSLNSDLTEDASSSYSSSSSLTNSNSNSNGPLYELSELMLQLPIKKGLSKHYEGKSQSYTSLASVKSIEDLAKKGITYSKKRRKSCSKSYAGGLIDHGHKLYSPKPTISKKTPKKASFLSLSLLGGRVSFMTSCDHPNPVSE